MPSSICPYLGTKTDPETPMAFASGNGRCYRSGKALSINVRHQMKYCLSAEHSTCPLLIKQQAKTEQAAAGEKAGVPKPEKLRDQKQVKPAAIKKSQPAPAPAPKPQPVPAAVQKPRVAKHQPTPAGMSPQPKPMPKSVQIHKPVLNSPVPQAPSKHKRIDFSKISLGLYGVLMTIAMVAVLAWGASLAGADLPAMFAARRTPQPTIQPAVTETPESYLPAASSLSTMIVNDLFHTSPTPAPTNLEPTSTIIAATKVVPTRTSAPLILQTTAQPTEACGAPSGWVQYVIRAGDTLSSLSRAYGVSLQQIQSANCMGSSIGLYAGTVIYVPFYLPPSYPTVVPTAIPTLAPTKQPTVKPTVAPTIAPTTAPTVAPTTAIPTEVPTDAPTAAPVGDSATAPPAQVPSSTTETPAPTASKLVQP